MRGFWDAWNVWLIGVLVWTVSAGPWMIWRTWRG